MKPLTDNSIVPNETMMTRQSFLIYCCIWVVLMCNDPAENHLNEYNIACDGGIILW